MRSHTRLWTLLALTAVLLLLLAACTRPFERSGGPTTTDEGVPVASQADESTATPVADEGQAGAGTEADSPIVGATATAAPAAGEAESEAEAGAEGEAAAGEETATTDGQAPEGETVVDVANSAGSFTILLSAIDAAGLTETLKESGPYTIFAPNDSAFAGLPEGVLDTLIADPEGQLKAVLLFHVVSGEVDAATLVSMSEVETLGGSLAVTVDDGSVFLNNKQAEVADVDVEAGNGLIHFIDAVLVPPEVAASLGLDTAAMAADETAEAQAGESTSSDSPIVGAGESGEGETGEGQAAVVAEGDQAVAVAASGTHVVQAGETLYRIGLQYGLSWVVLAEFNKIQNPNRILAGDVLLIPSGDQTTPPPTPSPTREVIYRVRPGDTLFRIGLRYGITWDQIAEANGIVNPNHILVGQELKIPTAAPGPPPRFTHLVVAGDTLSRLAVRYGVTWQAIAEANGLRSPYVIYPGQTLIIPGR